MVTKYFSKAAANILASLLPIITSPNQDGFVHGRIITDNTTLAQTISQNFGKTTRDGNIVLKIDMAKSFDFVNWGFWFKVLKSLGFG